MEKVIKPFLYWVILDKPVDKPREIYFEGIPRLIDTQNIVFSSLKQLSTIEVEEKFKGTLGIVSYSGDFKL